MAIKTKPLGALGRLEDVGVRLSVIQNTLMPAIGHARICVFGADHGVTDEGVSAYPKLVTAEMMRNFARGGAAINVIAESVGASVEVIDVGVDADLGELTSIRHESVRRGSRNMAKEPALTHSEVISALEVGAAAAHRAHGDGAQVLALGEMGIGNTTSAAALLAVLADVDAAATVGRGTGVTDEVLAHKRRVVARALALHASSAGNSTREALRCLGGLEIAAIAGAAREASTLGMAVIADGFISTTGVLAALSLANEESQQHSRAVADALFFSHRSAEAGHALALAQCEPFGCDSRPLLDLGLRLGEGTGAALCIPLLRAAAAVMSNMATFAEAGVSDGDHAEHRD